MGWQRQDPLQHYWPGLRDCDWEVTSPQDPAYNCLAYAVGEEDRVWDPFEDAGYYWPVPHPNSRTLSDVLKALESIGFAVTESEEPEPGWERVALFARNDEFEHAARQLPNGEWTSKLGDWEDIRHADLRALETRSESPYQYLYGDVAVIIRRKVE